MPGVADILTLGVAPTLARVQCILVHGRGQTPEDMEEAVIRRLSATDVAWHLPRAGGEVLVRRSRHRSTDRCHARGTGPFPWRALQQAVEAARQRADGRPIVLAGFSQGACLSLEHAFTGKAAPDAVVAFTGCRVGVRG